jgi:hypothetical protein
VQPGNSALTIQVPVAYNDDGTSIVETIWDDCTFFADTARCTFPYEAPSAYQSEATLYVRERRSDPPVLIPKSDWIFDGSNAIKLVASPFKKGFIYELIHKAANPPIMAIGYAAARDWVSFLRYSDSDDYGNANPLSGLHTFLAFGASQTGRFMRDFLYHGFNEEESAAGKRVFDGMDIHIAATRPYINFRFAQPTRRADFQHEDLFYPTSAFPFAYEDQTDPYSGNTDGILHKCAATSTCPKVMHTTSSLEFWQFKNSLVLTDPLGIQDVTIPGNVRGYTFTGGQHLPNRALVPEGVCEQASNIMDYRPLLRSILVALKDWTVSGILPPDSRHARIDDGTLVRTGEVDWPPIPGVTFAGPVVNQGNIYDYGPLFDQGIITQVLPLVTENKYQVLVPQVDLDGIDIAGIRLPVVSVPLATRTGWAVWNPSGPAGGELCNQDGSYIPFPATKAERVATGDPRLSIEERYPNHGSYVSKVANAVNRLVRERFLLEEDAEALKEEAAVSNIGKPQK